MRSRVATEEVRRCYKRIRPSPRRREHKPTSVTSKQLAPLQRFALPLSPLDSPPMLCRWLPSMKCLQNASNAVAIATTRVKELTASLNDMLGWPPDTELQLVPPDPRFEDISLREATDKALAANPEVIEAEQNVVKARAASTLQKLAYVPVVAAMGRYAYNSDVLPLLPRDFSFIGLVATYNLFDFGKREHTINGANAQAEMAEIALQLTKAKVAASVKNSHFELERSRQLSELTRRLDSAIQVQRASYDENSAEIIAAKKAKVEAEMFQADLDYRQALARLKTL